MTHLTMSDVRQIRMQIRDGLDGSRDGWSVVMGDVEIQYVATMDRSKVNVSVRFHDSWDYGVRSLMVHDDELPIDAIRRDIDIMNSAKSEAV